MTLEHPFESPRKVKWTDRFLPTTTKEWRNAFLVWGCMSAGALSGIVSVLIEEWFGARTWMKTVAILLFLAMTGVACLILAKRHDRDLAPEARL